MLGGNSIRHLRLSGTNFADEALQLLPTTHCNAKMKWSKKTCLLPVELQAVHSTCYVHRTCKKETKTAPYESALEFPSLLPHRTGQNVFSDKTFSPFQLRLPNSTFSDDVHLMFFDWLESIGCHVHDMSNPDEDEAINPDPEGWVQSILSRPNVKVVVIEGDPADIVDKDFSARSSPAMLEPRVVTPASPGTVSSSLTESVASSIDGRRVQDV